MQSINVSHFYRQLPMIESFIDDDYHEMVVQQEQCEVMPNMGLWDEAGGVPKPSFYRDLSRWGSSQQEFCLSCPAFIGFSSKLLGSKRFASQWYICIQVGRKHEVGGISADVCNTCSQQSWNVGVH